LVAVHSALEAHLGSRQVSRVIYGSIIGLALVVVLQAHPPAVGVIIASLLSTAVAVGLAELYSEVVGTETRTRHRIARTELGQIVEDVVAVTIGVAFPAIFFILAAAGAMEVDTAFQIAKWSGLALIGVYGFVAARFAGAGLVGAVAQGLAVAAIGAVMIAVKALVH
jgi:hypothetical protein